MAKAMIVLNKEGVRQMLRSDEAEAICREFAEKAAGSLGDGYEVSSIKGKKRANASIKAVTYRARKDAKQNNTLIKAVCGK
ncbi:hypothetical protein [uncultured Ruminococcus sp.]|uniref:hypothetical protein n=1 Tax=uncultured Ruminococcus sp. TaxID=165186 RepID=UPI0025CBF2E8|nr:hypothetical protein [uncultured Ruminococcus sp.]